MSDVAVAPVTADVAAPAVEAPVASEAPAASEVAEVRATPKNAREAAQMVRERSRDTIASQINARTDRPRNPDGTFASTQQEAPAAEAVAGTPATEAPASEAVMPTPPAAATQPEWVSINLQPDHPLRAQGRDTIRVHPEDEQAVRAALNNPIRRQEVEQTRQELQAERRARLEAEARAQVLLEQRSSALKNPEIAAKYSEIAQAWGQEEADRYLRGYENEWTEQITAKQKEAQEAFEAEQQRTAQQNAGRQFASDTRDILRSMGVADWWLERNYGAHIYGYGSQIDGGFEKNPSPERAAAIIRHAYEEDPYVKPYLQKTRMEQAQQHVNSLKEQLEAAAEAKRKRELEEMAARGRTNPLGRIPAGASTGQQAMPVSVGPRTAREAKQQLQDRSRGLV